MLKRLLYITAAYLAVMGCTDHSYKGVSDADLYGVGAYPVLVSVGPASEITGAGTKGTGAIDVTEGWRWNGEPIYIYSFRRGASFEKLSDDDSRSCLIDGSKDVPGTKMGKKAEVTTTDSYITWEGRDKNVFYSPETVPYDFYAYYTDDLDIQERDIRRTADAVEIDVKIDGARDLMTAKAELTEKQLNRDGFTDEDRKALKDFAFSSYTANRNIHPVMQFHHHLVRLCFFIYAGQEASEKVCVKKITVKSKDDAVFVVAHRDAEKMGLDFSRDGTPVELALTEKDGTPLDRNKYKPIYDPDKAGKDAFEQEPVLVGGSLLAAPSDEYEVTVTLEEPLEGGRIETTGNRIVIRRDFTQGSQYNIRLALFGASKIESGINLVPWGYGGDIILDEENMPDTH